jgi:hypothetical protein
MSRHLGNGSPPAATTLTDHTADLSYRTCVFVRNAPDRIGTLTSWSPRQAAQQCELLVCENGRVSASVKLFFDREQFVRPLRLPKVTLRHIFKRR